MSEQPKQTHHIIPGGGPWPIGRPFTINPLKPEDILFDDYLMVTAVKDATDPDSSQAAVEVQAENKHRPATDYWRSLRYNALPEDAPRARDVIHVLVWRLTDSECPTYPAGPDDPRPTQ